MVETRLAHPSRTQSPFCGMHALSCSVHVLLLNTCRSRVARARRAEYECKKEEPATQISKDQNLRNALFPKLEESLFSWGNPIMDCRDSEAARYFGICSQKSDLSFIFSLTTSRLPV